MPIFPKPPISRVRSCSNVVDARIILPRLGSRVEIPSPAPVPPFQQQRFVRGERIVVGFIASTDRVRSLHSRPTSAGSTTPTRQNRESQNPSAPGPIHPALALRRVPAAYRVGDPARGAAATCRPSSVGNRDRLAVEPPPNAVRDCGGTGRAHHRPLRHGAGVAGWLVARHGRVGRARSDCGRGFSLCIHHRDGGRDRHCANRHAAPGAILVSPTHRPCHHDLHEWTIDRRNPPGRSHHPVHPAAPARQLAIGPRPLVAAGLGHGAVRRRLRAGCRHSERRRSARQAPMVARLAKRDNLAAWTDPRQRQFDLLRQQRLSSRLHHRARPSGPRQQRADGAQCRATARHVLAAGICRPPHKAAVWPIGSRAWPRFFASSA